MADLAPHQLDLVIVATVTPDHSFPSTASLVQDALGASRAGAFDLSAGCSGFIYGLSLASGYIKAGAAEHVLVIGAETLSRIVDWTDRNTCVLFGDGAGAVVMSAYSDPAVSRRRSWAATAQVENCLSCLRVAVAVPLLTKPLATAIILSR